jgi:6-methylsalicylate decarboxylase
VLTRRLFLRHGLACAAAAQAGCYAGATRVSATDVVDVHYHVNTESVRRLAARSAMPDSTLDALPSWRPRESIEQMDRAGVALSVISTPVVPPIVPGGADACSAFARENNDELASIVCAHTGRFGFFAYVPMPFVTETLSEITYALDTLGAQGIYICTSYGDRWLGDEAFEPVMAELNAREAVVYTHPMGASCCVNGLVPPSTPLVSGVPPTVVEYGTDTSRTVASLIFSGTALRYPKIKFIFSHAGGTVPFLVERFEQQAKWNPQAAPQGAAPLLRKFFYDTAQSANPYALGTLLQLVPYTQVLFGSDAPWREQNEQLTAIDRMNVGSAATRAIRHGNAQRILRGNSVVRGSACTARTKP